MVTVQRATRNDLGPIADLDTIVLGEASRCPFLSNAVRDGECLVAKSRQRVVGLAVMDQSFYGHGFISLLIVHPEHRRKGIARALVEQIKSDCPTEKLFASTNKSNGLMQAVCGALGFSRSGQIENLDEGDPEIVYFKRLPNKAAAAEAGRNMP